MMNFSGENNMYTGQMSGTSASYTSLNDAADTDAMLSPGNTEVWYVKNGFYRDFCMGYDFVQEHCKGLFDPTNLSKTHVLIGKVTNSVEKEYLFDIMQGESWSPEGEAREMIGKLDTHTSMSVGDIVVQNGIVFMVDNFGFNAVG
jgi:hypothetical protein